ncbi:MAG: response regulator, partial [Pseudomonadota bacterium]
PGREDGEHVLLVEDNPEVRQTLRRQLESLGYKTTAAPDGQSALSVVEFDPSIEIVLSDVVMPGAIQGTNLAALLRESHPNLPVLLMSGNAAVLPGGLGNTPAEAVIQKPTPSDVLGRAIREALDRKGRAPST